MLVIIVAIRRNISGVELPPVCELLETNILEMLSQLFKFNDQSEEVRAMKLESLWILTNLAYGDENDLVKLLDPQFGVLDIMNVVLSGDDKAMIEQVLWLIGNISGQDVIYRNMIVESTCIYQTLLRLVEAQKISRYLLRTVCWVNSNLTRYKNNDNVGIAITVARSGIFTEDPDIVSDCLWAFTYITETNDDDQIDFVAKSDLVVRVVELMGSQDLTVFIPALRVIGNILTSSDP